MHPFFFPCITFIIWKKTDWWSKDRLTHKLYLHHHAPPHRVIKAMKIIFSGIWEPAV